MVKYEQKVNVYYWKGGITLDRTDTRILRAAMKGVRLYGLEGVRVQNIAELAGLTSGALYRHFDSKDTLMRECFIMIDRQVAALFDHLEINAQEMLTNPTQTVKALWLPYFRFWTSHPDETVFYHRFRDSASFPQYAKTRDESHLEHFIALVGDFRKAFPGLSRLNPDILWLHLLTGTVMYAKNVVEGVLPNSEATEDTVFQLLTAGITNYLTAN